MMSDAALRERLAANARRMVAQRFTMPHIAAQTLQVYEGLKR